MINLLNARGIRFVMRCDTYGSWKALREFMRGVLAEAHITLGVGGKWAGCRAL